MNTSVRKYDGTSTPFFSIPSSMWWAMVTMTTVGYGDDYPVTKLGQLIGMCTMLTGILLIALPVAIVGSEFQEVYKNNFEQQKLVKFSIGL